MRISNVRATATRLNANLIVLDCMAAMYRPGVESRCTPVAAVGPLSADRVLLLLSRPFFPLRSQILVAAESSNDLHDHVLF